MAFSGGGTDGVGKIQRGHPFQAVVDYMRARAANPDSLGKGENKFRVG
jgi:hypothetical protein